MRKRSAGGLRLGSHQTYLERKVDEATRRRHGGCGCVGGRHACSLSCDCLRAEVDVDVDKQWYWMSKEVDVAVADGVEVDKQRMG
jgi:hypothetical protein